MLTHFKNDKNKMRPHLMASRIAGLREHSKHVEKLIKDLGVFTTVYLSGEDAYLYDMDPEELDQLARDHISEMELFRVSYNNNKRWNLGSLYGLEKRT